MKDAKKDLKKGKKVKRKEIMGMLCRFEGIDKVDNMYIVRLGS